MGRFAPGLTEFSRSLPSGNQLVPEYACIDAPGGLLKTTETDVPGIDRARLADAMHFHAQLREAEAARPAHADMTLAIVGTRQPTWTTIRFADGTLSSPTARPGATVASSRRSPPALTWPTSPRASRPPTSSESSPPDPRPARALSVRAQIPRVAAPARHPRSREAVMTTTLSKLQADAEQARRAFQEAQDAAEGAAHRGTRPRRPRGQPRTRRVLRLGQRHRRPDRPRRPDRRRTNRATATATGPRQGPR